MAEAVFSLSRFRSRNGKKVELTRKSANVFEHGLEIGIHRLFVGLPSSKRKMRRFQKRSGKDCWRWSSGQQSQKAGKKRKDRGKSRARDIDQVSLSCRIIRLAATSISSEPSKRAALIYRDRASKRIKEFHVVYRFWHQADERPMNPGQKTPSNSSGTSNSC